MPPRGPRRNPPRANSVGGRGGVRVLGSSSTSWLHTLGREIIIDLSPNSISHLAPPHRGALVLAQLLNDVVTELAGDVDALGGGHHGAHLLLHLPALLLWHCATLLSFDNTALFSQLRLADLRNECAELLKSKW